MQPDRSTCPPCDIPLPNVTMLTDSDTLRGLSCSSLRSSPSTPPCRRPNAQALVRQAAAGALRRGAACGQARGRPERRAEPRRAHRRVDGCSCHICRSCQDYERPSRLRLLSVEHALFVPLSGAGLGRITESRPGNIESPVWHPWERLTGPARMTEGSFELDSSHRVQLRFSRTTMPECSST